MRKYKKEGGRTYVHLLVVIAMIALLTAWLVPMIQRVRDRSRLAQCRDNLRRIGQNLLQYARASGGRLPTSPTIENPQVELLNDLKAAGFLGDAKIFYCPAEQQSAFSYSEANFHGGNIGYYYFSAQSAGNDPGLSNFLRKSTVWPRNLKIGDDPGAWIMSDRWLSALPTSHRGYKKGVNFLKLDGSVDFLTESPRQQFR